MQKMSAEDRAAGIEQCHEELAKHPDDPMTKCIDEADSGGEVSVCLMHGVKDYRSKTMSLEVEQRLDEIATQAKVAFRSDNEYPKGKAATLPATGCCDQPDGECAETQDWAKDAVWKALGFRIDTMNHFQYSYDSDGKTAHATAVGDLDCDGSAATYKLDMSSENGEPTSTVTRPPPGVQ
jgi:hypothetical protein